MRSPALARDYVGRARRRLGAIEALMDAASWADVVCECDEVVDLALNGLLLRVGTGAPWERDLAPILMAERARLPKVLDAVAEELAGEFRTLRRDLELAFYGAEDLTPGEFYTEDDADRAFTSARRVVDLVEPHVGDGGPSEAS
jgi:HEPN domain-containing protein